MFDDIIWNSEASYGLLILNWVLTLSSALGVGLIISYVKSKTPAQKTIMDFVTKFFLALLLGACLVSSVIVTTLTHLCDSGETVATALSWTMFNLGQTARLEILAVAALQILCTQYPWLLESSTFEKAYKLVVAIIIPAISTSFMIACHSLGYNAPFYELLREKDIPRDIDALTMVRIVLISLVVIVSTLARLFIRMRDTNGDSPNYTLRLDITLSLALQNMALRLLIAPVNKVMTLPALVTEYSLMISVSHSGIRNYALNRPILRPLVTFYRRRLARRINNPYTVRC